MSKRVEKILNVIMSIFLVLMVTLVFYNAVLRYLFHSSMATSEELARFCFVWLSFLGIMMAYKSNEHVAVTVLTDKLHGKWKLAIQILRDLSVLFILMFMLVGGIKYCVLSNYKSVATNINMAMIVVSIPIAAFGMLCVWAFGVFQQYFQKKEEVK